MQLPLPKPPKLLNEAPSKIWPDVYSLENDGGRALVSAILHHNICQMMVELILVPIPFSEREAGDLVANALYHPEPSHEATWRTLTASSMDKGNTIIKIAERKCRAIGNEMITTWGLHTESEVQKELLTSFVELGTHCLGIWLKIMTQEERMVALVKGDAPLFDGEDVEVANQTQKVPGEFNAAAAPSPVLCMFPAFVQMSSARGDGRRMVVRKGKHLYPDSKILTQARREVAAVRSPRTHRRTLTVGSSTP